MVELQLHVNMDMGLYKMKFIDDKSIHFFCQKDTAHVRIYATFSAYLEVFKL